MSYNENGLFFVKPTKITIEPDAHACSFNELKHIRIEQESGIVSLNKFDIKEIVKLARDL